MAGIILLKSTVEFLSIWPQKRERNVSVTGGKASNKTWHWKGQFQGQTFFFAEMPSVVYGHWPFLLNIHKLLFKELFIQFLNCIICFFKKAEQKHKTIELISIGWKKWREILKKSGSTMNKNENLNHFLLNLQLQHNVLHQNTCHNQSLGSAFFGNRGSIFIHYSSSSCCTTCSVTQAIYATQYRMCIITILP